MKDFEPEPNRIGRTKCPPHFPPLDSFKWKVDAHWSIRCPPISDEVFTCPVPSSADTTYALGATPIVILFILGSIGAVYMFTKFLRMSHIRSALPSGFWEPRKDNDAEVSSEESRGLMLSGHGYYSSIDSGSDS